MQLNELLPILQAAVGPVILISGVGLLLLTMTNRYGRVIDRARQLAGVVQNPTDLTAKAHTDEQLAILWRRALLLRSAITATTTSALLAAVLVVSVFVFQVLEAPLGAVIGGLFVCALLSLVVGLAMFLRDVNLSLKALALEMGEHARG